MRLYAPRPLRLLAVGYIDMFRALPILWWLILIYSPCPSSASAASFVSATLACRCAGSVHAEVCAPASRSIRAASSSVLRARPAVLAWRCAR